MTFNDMWIYFSETSDQIFELVMIYYFFETTCVYKHTFFFTQLLFLLVLSVTFQNRCLLSG